MIDKIDSRASDPGVSNADSFKPGADPDEWIEQLAIPYRERPWAVIRELFQNASDAVSGTSRDEARFVELALLDTSSKTEVGRYHLVIRDSGKGMDDKTFWNRTCLPSNLGKKNR